MDTRKKGMISVFVFLIASVIVGFAEQDQAAKVEVVKIALKDGPEVIGTVEKEDATSLIFKTISNVEIVIPKDQIESIEELAGTLQGGKFLRVDPNSTRLF